MTSGVTAASPAAKTSTPTPGGTSLPTRFSFARVDFASLLRDEVGCGPPPAPGPTPMTPPAVRPPLDSAPASIPRPPGPPPADPSLDTLARHHALLRPPEALPGKHSSAAATTPNLTIPDPAMPADPIEATKQCAAPSLEDLLPALVRRVAWSGDGQRGTIRLELGVGALAGSTLLVHADAGRVRVRLDLPAGVNAAGLRERIEQRLHDRGVDAESVEVM
jgi:hypothetical protein